jgi:hypothetical protein
MLCYSGISLITVLSRLTLCRVLSLAIEDVHAGAEGEHPQHVDQQPLANILEKA